MARRGPPLEPGLAVGPTRIAERAMALGATQKPSELERFVELVAKRRPRGVVEIGTQEGGTFYAWCRTAHPDATLVSVDLPNGPFGGVEVPDLERTLRRFAHARQAVHCLPVRSQLDETRDRVARHLAGERLELLFIDGDHSYEGVKRDYELYAPLVATGGMIAFHDIVEHPEYPVCQVDRVWREVKDDGALEITVEGEERTWGPWGGIGVLFVG